MAGADQELARKTEELVSTIHQIRDRVRSRHPRRADAPVDLPLADLTPLLQARDAAEAKVAAIGSVNPRRPGVVNDLVQGWKRMIARLLDWHVREQVEFNRAAVGCVNAAIEALNESNRALEQLARRDAQIEAIDDLRSRWETWHPAWERKLEETENRLLRGVAELESAHQYRAAELERSFRELVRSQEASFRELATTQDTSFRASVEKQNQEFHAELAGSMQEVQKKLWDDLARVRTEYERLIHSELRVLRQRTQAANAEPPEYPEYREYRDSPPVSPIPPLQVDYLRFADRFRGDEEHVRGAQRFYVERFRGCGGVLDIGCGRGEFLDLMKEAGIPARGVDASEEFVALCRAKGLQADRADLFDFLAAQPDRAFDGIFCAQLVEHLPPARVPDLIVLAARKLAVNGLIAIETPNPECLAIFATHFYLDPTHTRPVPSQLLAFYLEEAGFGAIDIRRFYPAADTIPELASLAEPVRNALFGALDYAILARRLG